MVLYTCNHTDTVISSLDWHLISVEEVCQRLSTSLNRGIDETQATRKRSECGKNVPSPAPSHLIRRTLGYVFGGFGSLLIVAGILCCVAWKPLGEPAPQVSNLALGVVLFIVASLQAFFNAWQVHLNAAVLY
jgi:sodium/potassium-transporting ATPase subunit alpha